MKQTIAQITAVIGLALLVVVSPWLFGAVKAQHQQWLFLLAGLSLLPGGLLLAWDGPRSNRGGVPLTILPLFGAACLGLAQLIPLSTAQHQALSPEGLGWWQLSAVTTSGTPAAQYPISLYPQSTRHDVALLGLAVAVFVMASMIVTERLPQLILCGIAAVNGAAFALFGIVQQLTYDGELYWSIPLRQGGNPFAAFVNRNHAGGYLNLCVAASLVMLIGHLIRQRGNDPDDFVQAYAWESTWKRWTYGVVSNLDAATLLTVSMAVATAAGVVCSLSRGAILALLLATCVAGIVAIRQRKSSAVVIVTVLVLAVGVGLAVWLGRGELLRERLNETVADIESQGSSRVDHWQDVIAVCGDYWLTGTGLGTYRYIYRPYESQLYTGWFYHAENQYLESLVEGGLAGSLLILAAILSVSWACRRLLLRSEEPMAFALGIAGLFAVASQTVHSMFDFGLYMPANAILFAMLCGLCCARVPPEDTSDNLWVLRPGWPSRVIHGSVLLLTFAWICWGGWQIHKAAVVENCTDTYWQLDDVQLRSPSETEPAIRQFESAIKTSPCDAEARFRLANFYVLNYRAEATDQILRQGDMEESSPEAMAAWQLTAPVFLHRRAQALQNDSPKKFQELRRQPLVRRNLDAAVDHLWNATQCCPIMGKANVALAELFVALPPNLNPDDFVQKAVRLAPNDPDILFRCGLLDLQSGRVSNGLAKWRKCLSLSAHYTEQILRLGTQFVNEERLVAEALPDSAQRIVEIASKVDSPQLQTRLADRAAVALEHSPLRAAETWHLRGSIAELKQDLAKAVECYSQAVGLEPENLAWRFELAVLLAKHRLFSEAQPHAAFCVKNAPRLTKHRELLKRVNAALRTQTGRDTR